MEGGRGANLAKECLAEVGRMMHFRRWRERESGERRRDRGKLKLLLSPLSLLSEWIWSEKGVRHVCAAAAGKINKDGRGEGRERPEMCVCVCLERAAALGMWMRKYLKLLLLLEKLKPDTCTKRAWIAESERQSNKV